jgi:hypothetical protein
MPRPLATAATAVVLGERTQWSEPGTYLTTTFFESLPASSRKCHTSKTTLVLQRTRPTHERDLLPFFAPKTRLRPASAGPPRTMSGTDYNYDEQVRPHFCAANWHC